VTGAGFRWSDGDNMFRFVDIKTGKPCRQFDGHSKAVECVACSPDGKYIATNAGVAPPELRVWEVSSGRVVFQDATKGDTTALLWDVAGLDPGTPAAPLTPDQRTTCWNDLAGGARQANDAIWKLVNDAHGLELLRAKVKPASAPADAQLVSRLLTDLDSDRFPVRSRAQERLAILSTAVETQLRNALTGKTTLESRQRVEKLLAAIEGERLRTRRAIETLELINTAPARELLQRLTNGSAGNWLTLEAKDSLDRLRMRPAR